MAAVSVAMSVFTVSGSGRGGEGFLDRLEEGRGAGSGRSRERGVQQRGRGGGGRGVATYHTPSIPKSRGRLAPRQIAVASTPRFSASLEETEKGPQRSISRK